MMKNTLPILILPAFFSSLLAVQTADTVSTTVDTRDYVVTYISPYGDIFPSAASYTTSWRGGAYSSVSPSPLFEQDGTILRNCTGFVGEGISPSFGSDNSASFIVTSVNATLTWQWESSFWVTWSVSGQGSIQASRPASGAWYYEGQSYLLKAIPEEGWLFTGWDGGASGGRETSSLDFTATAPADVVAVFSDDADNDGLKNTDESTIGTDPWLADTDGDNFGDKLEFDNGGDPTVSDSWRLTHIQNNPETFGLYTPESVLDLSLNQVGFYIEESTARLSLQLEQSEDLRNWTDAGESVEWTMPVDSSKKFLRVRPRTQ